MKGRIADRMIKKDGTVSARYSDEVRIIFREIVQATEKGRKSFRVHPKMWTGTRRHLTLVDNTHRYKDILEALGLAYVAGNDAPRGGAEGDYIEAFIDGRNRAVQTIRKRSDEFATFGNDWRRGGRYLFVSCAPKAVAVFNDIIKEVRK